MSTAGEWLEVIPDEGTGHIESGNKLIWVRNDEFRKALSALDSNDSVDLLEANGLGWLTAIRCGPRRINW